MPWRQIQHGRELKKGGQYFYCPSCAQGPMIKDLDTCYSVTHPKCPMAPPDNPISDTGTHFCYVCLCLLDSDGETEKKTKLAHYPYGKKLPCRDSKPDLENMNTHKYLWMILIVAIFQTVTALIDSKWTGLRKSQTPGLVNASIHALGFVAFMSFKGCWCRAFWQSLYCLFLTIFFSTQLRVWWLPYLFDMIRPERKKFLAKMLEDGEAIAILPKIGNHITPSADITFLLPLTIIAVVCAFRAYFSGAVLRPPLGKLRASLLYLVSFSFGVTPLVLLSNPNWDPFYESGRVAAIAMVVVMTWQMTHVQRLTFVRAPPGLLSKLKGKQLPAEEMLKTRRARKVHKEWRIQRNYAVKATEIDDEKSPDHPQAKTNPRAKLFKKKFKTRKARLSAIGEVGEDDEKNPATPSHEKAIPDTHASKKTKTAKKND